MKLRYDRDTDMLHISFGERLEVEGFDLCDGVVVHLDGAENVAAIEIENASKRVDLDGLRTVANQQESEASSSLKDRLLASEGRSESLSRPRS